MGTNVLFRVDVTKIDIEAAEKWADDNGFDFAADRGGWKSRVEFYVFYRIIEILNSSAEKDAKWLADNLASVAVF